MQKLLSVFTIILSLVFLLTGCFEDQYIRKTERVKRSDKVTTIIVNSNSSSTDSAINKNPDNSVSTNPSSGTSSKNSPNTSSSKAQNKPTSSKVTTSEEEYSDYSPYEEYNPDDYDFDDPSPDTPEIREPKLPDDKKLTVTSNGKPAYYSYKSSTLTVEIQQYETAENQKYWLAHVIVASPTQICGGLANNRYGSFERPSSASKRMGWVLGINGSYFSYSTGKPYGSKVVIKGSAIKEDGLTSQTEICLMRDGTLFTPQSNLTAKQLLDMGVIESWSTCDPLMISDGVRRRTEVINENHAVGSKAYPRTAIGMVKPCEYYILVAGERTEESGLSFVKMQNVFYDLCCTYARSFDGGGSSSLVYKNELINLPKDGSERAVVDFLYFKE